MPGPGPFDPEGFDALVALIDHMAILRAAMNAHPNDRTWMEALRRTRDEKVAEAREKLVDPWKGL